MYMPNFTAYIPSEKHLYYSYMNHYPKAGNLLAWQFVITQVSNYVALKYIKIKYDIRLSGLMKMASYQTFSGQTKHLSSHIKFDQTNLPYIINGEVIKFAEVNKCLDDF